MAAALGAEPDLIPMVLNLRLMPKRRLNLRGRDGSDRRKGKCWKVLESQAQKVFWGRLPAMFLASWMAVLGSHKAPTRVTPRSQGTCHHPQAVTLNSSSVCEGTRGTNPQSRAKVTQSWDIGDNVDGTEGH